jgi:hypothetical protein
MSTNRKIRFLTSNLPEIPVIRKGKIAHDGYGRIIHVNHFKQLSKIRQSKTLPQNVKDTLCSNYIHRVWQIDKMRKEKREMRVYKSVGVLAIFLLVGIILHSFLK